MSKKIMMLALAVAGAAIFALPAVASAQSWHTDQTTNFSINGAGGTMTTSSGNVVCSLKTGSGSFSTTTEGAVTIIYHGCKALGLFNCTSPGQPAGTVKLSAKFDAVMLATNKPGVLLTPTGTEPTPVSAPGWKSLGEFSCTSLTIEVFGKGMLGTITAPACGVASSTATWTFASSATGVQEHQSWTGNPFDMKSTISSSHPTWSYDGSTTVTFPAARTMTCTHTSVVG